MSYRGYELPVEYVEWPYYARYEIIQNIDEVPGVFTISYVLTTADKEAALSQMFLSQRTDEEWAALDREVYTGSTEIFLEPGEVGVVICPPNGILITSDRVAFDHEVTITPSEK